MIGSCRLNNKTMRNIRRSEVYQALAIDFAMLGVISKEECEMLLGGGIPEGIFLPNGEQGSFISEKNLPPKPDFIQTEPDDETQETGDTGDTGDTEGKPEVSPELIPGVTEMPGNETVSDGATTDEQLSVDPVDITDGLTDQEPVNDEGRTESDN